MAKKRLLFVDDEFAPEKDSNESLGSYMSMYLLELSDAGYTVDCIRDVDEAWEKLQAEKYDLIILDLMMPPGNLFSQVDTGGGGLCGYFFAKKVHNLKPSLPILFLSAAAQIAEFQQKWQVGTGARKLLIKLDTSPADLLAVVSDMI